MIPRVSAAHQAPDEPTLIDSGVNMGYWLMHFNQTRVLVLTARIKTVPAG